MRSEFVCKNFGLGFHKPEAFCESQWRWPRVVFVLYRLLMSGYSVFAFTHMVVMYRQNKHGHSVMAWLTTWTFLVETVFFLLGAILALLHFSRPGHFRSGDGTEGAVAESRPGHFRSGGGAEGAVAESRLRHFRSGDGAEGAVAESRPGHFRSGDGAEEAVAESRPGHFRSVDGAEKAVAESRQDKGRSVELGHFVYTNDGSTNGTSDALETSGHGGGLQNQVGSFQNGSSKKTSSVAFIASQEPGSNPTPKHAASLNEGLKPRKGDLETGAPSECENAPRSACMAWYLQAYWVLSNVIQVFAFIVTFVYFGALYSADESLGLPDINVHGLNSVMILIDNVVCARPVRLLHGLYPLLYGSLYVIFSVIYWSTDKVENVLYENVLDWNQAGISTGVSLGVAVIAVPLLQLANLGLYKFRLCLHDKLYGEQYL
ncbi:uncharacterized protein [Littorina saxatilis]|uniref:Transmembrane protein n=1 Tax=Littorina saxatilis TaxID=31220 RepID=A0AAN9AMJ8_9CAEN